MHDLNIGDAATRAGASVRLIKACRFVLEHAPDLVHDWNGALAVGSPGIGVSQICDNASVIAAAARSVGESLYILPDSRRCGQPVMADPPLSGTAPRYSPSVD